MTTNVVQNQNGIQKKMPTLKEFFEQDNVKKKFQELLGKKSQGFITSVLQCVASNDLLAKAEPSSIYHAAAVAATLDLPLNNALGMAYIVPYNQKQKDNSYKTVAQFQMGYKSFIQLSQRSGQFKTIAAAPIYEGQLIESNPLTGYKFDFTKKTSETVIGYAGFFQLINGFEKTLYMTVDELKKHGSQYSQTFKKGFGLWKDNFDAMATKTVIKLLLSKFAPLSIEMQKAVISDQGLIVDSETDEVEYVDNEAVSIDKEAERIRLMLADCKTIEEVNALQNQTPDADLILFAQRREELKPAQLTGGAIPDSIFFEIETAETIGQLNAIEADCPEFKENKEFINAINNKKIAMGKILRGGKN